MLRGRKRYRATRNEGAGAGLLDENDGVDADPEGVETMLDRAERFGMKASMVAAGNATSQPSLVGRLLCVSRIRWFGKPGKSASSRGDARGGPDATPAAPL